MVQRNNKSVFNVLHLDVSSALQRIYLPNMNGFRELLRVYIVTNQQTIYASIQYNVDSSEKGIRVICIFLRVEIALYCIYFCLNQNKL